MANEEAELGLRREAEAAGSQGIRFSRAPIEDRSTPSDPAAFEEVVAGILADGATGRRIVVHCRQSLGRAPLVAAAVLVRLGRTPGEAWRTVTDARGRTVPDTEDQREWLTAFAKRLPAAAGHSG